MKRKKLYFSLYVKDELENDIEILGTFDSVNELQKFFNKSVPYFYKLGVTKRPNLRIELKIDDINYMLIVDKDSE